MKAAVYYGPNKLEIADVPEPQPGPGTVKVKVGFNGICGTDLHEYYAGPIFVPTEPHPLTGRELPLTMGHEFAGTILEVGAGVTGYVPGDRVAIEPIYRCGRCAPCRAGTYNVCQQIGFHGLMSDGGMAEYTIVPVNMLHRLPDNVSLELGALVEPMAVAYHAAALGDVGPGDTAIIFGAGPIGIGLWFALQGMGLESVYVAEPSSTRRTAIEALGAHTLDPTQVDVSAFVTDVTDGRGADAAFDAAGVKSAIEAATASVGARRPTISVAIYEKPLTVPLLNLVMNESRLQGSLCYTSTDFEAVIALMAQGVYDTTGWVTTVRIDDVINEGFEALHAGRKMKVLVDPSDDM
ncbi:(R,R)-butanediol dehydrogenase / meso-butanediol dehydrogenase / diacetyl reductase [Rhodococcus rhodochrous J3]|jgi:(R,R)-butanediol dehydrogenase/meso-butanediol dehydrogenase/diacetyl reductase|uniref:(R,R)-butanediol dehydrogenase/meso-butanediol dehydrogenase/diacetyl reductase n=3 Tax=Rhodococcus rhodochrous TaxID=1829 RepID=A0A562E2K7_RHORH|nr:MULTISPECIES: 2,3-butanediol dehydrogenase [Rhodococcus]MBF4477823.1 2,3-butanediol dehydrogenase [Rhodococcus rhodochrous]MCB8913757.1 2,3-butanediol dehydrogenase [Rhodococcus rhodochrous]MCD2100381.1 2,3-butanediol dehydrogenase [Rhodococcus rhodochrous]MCD2124806.1 2,3-butanediol dehydrogenase [Rhodococcus rhodochrous]MCK8672212.1 2,3-butanediol dehydrogenase [Rhodococcus sp. HM1]